MDRKRLAASLPWIVGLGFCVVEVIKIALLSDSTASNEPASGHVAPMLFAPQISTDWRYVTDGQMLFIAVVTVAVLLLAGLLLTSRWWARDPAPPDPAADITPTEPTPPTEHRRPPARRSFGHR